jgi:hypothetical protein
MRLRLGAVDGSASGVWEIGEESIDLEQLEQHAMGLPEGFRPSGLRLFAHRIRVDHQSCFMGRFDQTSALDNTFG